MKISVNDVELYTLTDLQKQVIENDIPSEILQEDLERRLQWVLIHKYERCFDRLKKEWDSKLEANGETSIPLDKDAYATLVFDQPNYKDRSARDAK